MSEKNQAIRGGEFLIRETLAADIFIPEEWTEAVEDAVYSRVRESESLNINFEASGIESKLFI